MNKECSHTQYSPLPLDDQMNYFAAVEDVLKLAREVEERTLVVRNKLLGTTPPLQEGNGDPIPGGILETIRQMSMSSSMSLRNVILILRDIESELQS